MNINSNTTSTKFSNTEILDLFIQYLSNYFKLGTQSNAYLYCDKEFNFKYVDKVSMEVISILSLDDLFNSCNEINCNDDLFENKLDMISEIKATFDNDFIKILSKEMWSRFEIMCIEC